MNFLEDVPAVRRIDTDRDDLLAVEIVGRVGAADAENLFGLLEAACALNSRIDVLVRLTDLEGVDWAAIAPETLEQGKAETARHVRRCAAVGDPDWTTAAQGRFRQAEPVEIRHFAAEDEASAWKWLGAREKPVKV
ncbi:MAG: STAS/SEC14 domain-containing protein [Mesorhizobium sp.]|nr:STAS/SEC14 domain-containing protein [Mesorhizobium sp.]MBN9244776.1 STAS/SEC14 domain-containing protein [Mesorhizobium sp.]